jgi:TolA-binding protein
VAGAALLLATACAIAGCGAAGFQGSAGDARPAGAGALRPVPRADYTALDSAVVAAAQGRYGDARNALADLSERFEAAGDTAHAAQALFWLSYCYEKTGRKNQAEVFYRQVVRRYGGTRAAEQASRRLERLDVRPPADGGGG